MFSIPGFLTVQKLVHCDQFDRQVWGLEGGGALWEEDASGWGKWIAGVKDALWERDALGQRECTGVGGMDTGQVE